MISYENNEVLQKGSWAFRMGSLASEMQKHHNSAIPEPLESTTFTKLSTVFFKISGLSTPGENESLDGT